MNIIGSIKFPSFSLTDKLRSTNILNLEVYDIFFRTTDALFGLWNMPTLMREAKNFRVLVKAGMALKSIKSWTLVPKDFSINSIRSVVGSLLGFLTLGSGPASFMTKSFVGQTAVTCIRKINLISVISDETLLFLASNLEKPFYYLVPTIKFLYLHKAFGDWSNLQKPYSLNELKAKELELIKSGLEVLAVTTQMGITSFMIDPKNVPALIVLICAISAYQLQMRQQHNNQILVSNFKNP